MPEPMPAIDNQIKLLLPRMAKFDRSLKDAIRNKETGCIRINVHVTRGTVGKVQVFTEDTVNLGEIKSEENSDNS